MASQSANPRRTNPDLTLRGPRMDDHVRQLLVHLDQQEVAMSAVRSLLQDLSRQSLARADRRQMRSRLTAAVQLTTRLSTDREILLSQIAERLHLSKDGLTMSHLIKMVSPEMQESLAAARRRVMQLATQLSRESATVRMVMGEERRINALAYQMATGMIGSERYDSSGDKSVQPSTVHFDVRS